MKRARFERPRRARIPLDLDRFIPIRDVRKLMWRYLTALDRELVRCAHAGGRRLVMNQERSELCALYGYLKLAKQSFDFQFGYRTICAAAAGGHVPFIRWLQQAGCSDVRAECVAIAAAANGHVHVLKWLEGGRECWGPDVCKVAAMHAQLDALKYLRSLGCTWNANVCHWAAHNGDLELLQWAVANQCPLNERTREWATRAGQEHVLS